MVNDERCGLTPNPSWDSFQLRWCFSLSHLSLHALLQINSCSWCWSPLTYFSLFCLPIHLKKSKTAFRQNILNSSLHSHRKCSFEYKLPVSVIDSSHQLAGFLWQWQAECQTQWWGRQSSPAAKWSWMKLSLHCLVADRNPQCPSPLRRCWAAAGSRCRIMVAVGSPPGRFSLESS